MQQGEATLWITRHNEGEAISVALGALAQAVAEDVADDFGLEVDYNDDDGYTDLGLTGPVAKVAGTVKALSERNASVWVGGNELQERLILTGFVVDVLSVVDAAAFEGLDVEVEIVEPDEFV